MPAFDVKAAEAEAKKELQDENSKVAKQKIKGKLAQISSAEAIVANLRREYEALLAEIAAG